MSYITMNEGAAPSTPASTKGTDYLSSATPQRRGFRTEDGILYAYTGDKFKKNVIINGGFSIAQRQVLTTLTTYSNTTGRSYGPDRWGVTNENASAQFQSVLADVPEAGLQARYYGRFKKITAGGKVIASQVIESHEVMPLRGRTVCLSFQARFSVAASMTIRAALLQLTSAGTTDTIPATFVSAFGGAGTDPTWGANLNAITPDKVTGTGGTISGAGVSAVLAATWQKYTVVFTVPTTAKNLVVALFTNALPAANDEMNIAEVSLTDGEGYEDWQPRMADDEMSLCLRYYTKTFAANTAPATNVGVTTGCLRCILGFAGATALAAQMQWQFPAPMRITPTVVLFNPGAANAQIRQISGTAADLTASASANATDRSVDFTGTGAGTGVVGAQCGLHATADAEL